VEYLADTNVASRSVIPAAPQYPVIVSALDRLIRNGDVVYVTAQVLVEFHAMATRPAAANGFGFPVTQAVLEARKIEAAFPRLPETDDIYHLWRTLVERYAIVGRQVYDARLVAVMLAHGVTHVLTNNAAHFRRFSEITAVEPADVR
jgi:predicted nucleic acid-binding protein